MAISALSKAGRILIPFPPNKLASYNCTLLLIENSKSDSMVRVTIKLAVPSSVKSTDFTLPTFKPLIETGVEGAKRQHF